MIGPCALMDPASIADPMRCDWCGAALVGRQLRWCSRACSTSFWENHQWSMARTAAMRRDGSMCVRCGAPAEEVNHIVPRNGAGYDNGCAHHIDGLESLCHDCHVIETTRQGRERRGLPLEGPLHPTASQREALPLLLWGQA